MSKNMGERTITGREDAVEWIARLVETLANDGHDVVNAQILALGRRDLQMAFAALFSLHLRLLMQMQEMQDMMEVREQLIMDAGMDDLSVEQNERLDG